MRIACTGNLGFIGTHLQKRLEREGHEIIGIDLKDCKDILDLTADDLYGVEYVFHLAAEVSVPKSIEIPIYTTKVNALGTLNVLECAKKAGVKRVIFSSTCAVYGIDKDSDSTGSPYSEDMQTNPVSPYGTSKLCGEYFCKMYSSLYGLDTVSLRYFNVYGEGMKADSQYSAAIALFLDKKKKGETLQVYGGKQTRDFVHVEDIVEANIKSMDYQGSLEGMAINIGTGQSYSIEDIARTISLSIDFLPQREGEMNKVRAYTPKARDILQWTPAYDVKEWICAQ